MSQASRGAVVIDTGVFGARLTLRTRPLATLYEPLIEGRAALISFVTVAELRFGARLAAWGPERRQSLEGQLALAETVWPGPGLTDTYAALRVWCVREWPRPGTEGSRGRPMGSGHGDPAPHPTRSTRCHFRQRQGSPAAHETRPVDQDHGNRHGSELGVYRSAGSWAVRSCRLVAMRTRSRSSSPQSARTRLRPGTRLRQSWPSPAPGLYAGTLAR
jgi:hypothetical protein